MLPRSFRTFFAIIALLLGSGLAAQDQQVTRMLFVMDASNSMNAFWGNQPKINTARELLLESLEQLEGTPDLELALRLYGHQTAIEPGKQDCDDTRLEVPFSERSVPEMRRVLEAVRCVGTTPIARSLEKAAGDFPDDPKARNIIILITDGIEACDEDPCAVSRALQARGIILKPFVIGVGLDDGQKYSLQCVGNYYDASTPELFDQVLQVVITQALNSTTAEIDLLTVDGKPTETDVPVTLYDQRTGEVRYHFVHTLNARGRPDTLSIDPVYTYRLVAHTIPPVSREDVTVKPGTHTIITLSAGQGQLELKMGSGLPEQRPTPCIVRRQGDGTTLNVQDINTTDKYLVGRYDLEFLTLPRLKVEDVTIEQGKTATVLVPQTGVLNILPGTPGYGAVFLREGDRLVHVVDLDPSALRHQYRLLPGTYQVVYRSRSANRTEYSTTKDAMIESGRSITINF